MNDDVRESLSGRPTMLGAAKPVDAPSSIEEVVFAGIGSADADSLSGNSTVTNDEGGKDSSAVDHGMEIVDLSLRYLTEKVLGKGGMGEVLLVRDNRLPRKVAIKRILGKMANSPIALRRFAREAKLVAALNHQNIIQIIDFGRDKDGLFLIMEYVEGGSLLERCRDGALPVDEAVELACQMCAGLAKAHDAGIIHRDLKPANVLLTLDGIPKLTDFGLAKNEDSDEELSGSHSILGTPGFMPPEQVKSLALVDARSDLWSLGATLYQMVTGESPRVIDLEIVPQELRSPLAIALKRRKEDRFQTAREFRDALRACLSGGGSKMSDLGEGQCLLCGSKNDSGRKYCKKCGGALEVPCLSCSSKIPVWEKFCGGCGKNQLELTAKRTSELLARQSEAEALLENYDYAAATQVGSSVGESSDPRFAALKGWTDQFLKTVEQGRQQQRERMASLIREARQHEKGYDYQSAIDALNKVPANLRHEVLPNESTSVVSLLTKFERDDSEWKRLDRTIRQRVKARNLSGLLPDVATLRDLRPDREDVAKLHENLIERERKLIDLRNRAFAESKRLFDSQKYEVCLNELQSIDDEVITPEIVDLTSLVETRLRRLNELKLRMRMPSQPGLGGVLEEYLTLKPDDTDVQHLLLRLSEQEMELNAARTKKLIDLARSKWRLCQFDAATDALTSLPTDSQEALDLWSECDALGRMQKEALSAIQQGMQSQNFGMGIDRAKNYRDALQQKSLSDSDFESLYVQCLHSLMRQKEALAAAERERVKRDSSSTSQQPAERECATFAERTCASVVDYFIGFILGFPVGAVLTSGSGAAAVFATSFCIFLFECVLVSSHWQATLGKRMVGIRVEGVDGQRLSFMQSFGRALVKIILGLGLYGSVTLPFTKRRQAVHDLAAKSVVVRVRR